MEIEFISNASSKFEKVYLYNNKPGKMQENTKYFLFYIFCFKGNQNNVFILLLKCDETKTTFFSEMFICRKGS